MILALLLLAASFPSSSVTSWMSPAAFHLKMGMPLSEVKSRLKQDGWATRPGKEPNHLIVNYGEKRTVTLMFQSRKLQSARFELVDFTPQVKAAFKEQKAQLQETLGPPDPVSPPNTLVYGKRSPNVFVVLSTSPKTEMGRQGLGFLAVRYFVPPAK